MNATQKTALQTGRNRRHVISKLMGKGKKRGGAKKKSMKLGHGGRAAKLKSALSKKGLPKKEIGGIIGNIARKKGAAPGQKNYHG